MCHICHDVFIQYHISKHIYKLYPVSEQVFRIFLKSLDKPLLKWISQIIMQFVTLCISIHSELQMSFQYFWWKIINCCGISAIVRKNMEFKFTYRFYCSFFIFVWALWFPLPFKNWPPQNKWKNLDLGVNYHYSTQPVIYI